MTVYIDSFVIFNFFINYLILIATKLLHNPKTTRFKMLAGSAICVLYSAMMFLKNTDFLLTYPCKLIFSLLITGFVYRHNNIYDYIRTVLVFYIVTFVFGGCVHALINNADLKLIFIATAFTYTLLSLFSDFYKRVSNQKNSLVSLEIICNDVSYKLTGLNDTGNSLRDPYTKLPVIIVSSKSINNVNKPMRLIPYKSVGKSNGLINGFTPDKVMVGGKEFKCVIGIYDDVLSYDGTFEALINSEGSYVK